MKYIENIAGFIGCLFASEDNSVDADCMEVT